MNLPSETSNHGRRRDHSEALAAGTSRARRPRPDVSLHPRPAVVAPFEFRSLTAVDVEVVTEADSTAGSPKDGRAIESRARGEVLRALI